MTPLVSIEIPSSDALFARLSPVSHEHATHVLGRDAIHRLELRRVEDPIGRGIRVDLAAIGVGSANALRRQPLLRAIGDAVQVVDATAGLLADAWLIAASGRRVVAVERDPIVHALALDGLIRAARDASLEAIAARIELHAADAVDMLAAKDARALCAVPTAILLDPMFPPKRKKSALPPKEMQILKELLGEQSDESRLESERTLLRFAQACDAIRVVVKRPEYAGDFAGVRPSWSLHGRLVRFDVYARHPEGASHG